MVDNKEQVGIDISPKKDGGILKEIIKEGVGDETICNSDDVIIHYTGTLSDGTQFDSSRDKEEKYKFTIGKGNVIKGLDIGIATMKRGEQAKFTIKPLYGYGKKGNAEKNVPPSSTLIFDVELFDFHGEDISKDKDMSLIKRVLVPGVGSYSPIEGAFVYTNLKGTYQGRVFDERKVNFEMGLGDEHDIVTGIEEGLLKMKKGDKFKFKINSKHAWGAKGCEKFNIPPFADIEYEVYLDGFEKPKESHLMSPIEKISEAEAYKIRGTELYKEGKYSMALKKYQRILQYLENAKSEDENDKRQITQLQVAGGLNVAACELKLNGNSRAIDACEKVLKLEPKNEKALFRTAQAHFNLTNYGEAIEFYTKVLEVNKKNKDAIRQLEISKQNYKEYNVESKKLFSKMFNAIGTKPNEENSESNDKNPDDDNCDEMEAIAESIRNSNGYFKCN